MNISTLFAQLRSSWRPILVIHFLFTLGGAVILTPLFALLLQGTLALSGNAAVMDQDIAFLLLSPLGLMTGILLFSVLLAIAGLELGALQVVAQASCAQQQLTALPAARFALAHALLLLRLTIGLTLRLLAYLVPFLGVAGLVAWQLLGAHDINFYLSEHPPEFMIAVAVATVLGAVLTWYLGRRLLGWSMALPLVLFAGVKPEQAFAASEDLVAGQRMRCLKALGNWLLLALLLLAIPFIFLQISLGPMLSSSGTLVTMALVIGLLGSVWTLLGYLVAALNMAGFSFVIANLYRDLSESRADSEVIRTLATSDTRVRFGWTPGRFAMVLALLLIAEMAYLMLMLRNVDMDSEVLIIAHRGAAGAAPENTMAAIQRAIADGTDWVEIDVQETRDGQVIVVHDSDFMKLAGNPMKVWEGDLAQARQIDIGSWFDPAFSEQRVPTLAEVLQVIRQSDARLVIELKYYGHDVQLEQRVVDIVEAADMADRVAVMSLKLEGVQKIQALRPKWHAGLLAVTALGDITRLDVDFLAVNQSKANAAFIRRAHNAGKTVFVWTVNDALSLSHWMSMGVDGIITDEPALARDILAQRAQLSAPERLLLSAALFFGKPEAVKQYRDNSP